MSKWLPWMRNAVADAAQHPDASDAALARWNDRCADAFRKAKKRCPEFDNAIQDARSGKPPQGEVLDFEPFVREILEFDLYPEGTLYKRVLDHGKALNSGQFNKAVLTGGIGSSKTTLCCLTLAYQLYRLMMQPDPHAYCKLDANHAIIFAVANRTRRLAKLNDFALLYSYVSKPKFQAMFPFDTRIKSRIVFLKSRVQVWPISSDTDLLGMSAFAVAIDEINFFETVQRSKRSLTDDRVFDAGRETYEGISRRLLSRLDESGGMLLVASSNRFKGELTAKLIDELSGDPGFYHFHETAWSICPEKFADEDRFAVFVGDDSRSPRILGDDEVTHPRDRDLIVRVPSRFRRSFKGNLQRSLQDIAGVQLSRIGSYFTDREKVDAAACLPNRLVSAARVVGDAMQLYAGHVELPCPESPRAIHADLSLSGDSTGLCVAHIRGYDSEGRPLIDVDALAEIVPPRHAQISIDAVFKLVQAWQQTGVPIRWFTADNFMSADLLQRIRRLGISAERLSCDRTLPDDPSACYESLRVGIDESRIRFPHSDSAVAELLALEYDAKVRKVDHPPAGGKDISDSLAGAIYRLSQVPPWQLVGVVENAGFAAAVNQPRLGGTITPIRNPGVGAMDLIRAARGMPSR